MALTGTNIIGRIALPDDTNPVNSVVRFIMTGFDTDDTENATIIQIPIDATIDALGDIDVNLWPNPLGVRSTFYATYVRIPDGNTNDVINVYVGQISVPATGGPYDLNDLLPIAPPAGADVADYIAQLAAAVALAESAAGGVFAAAAEASATSAELAAIAAGAAIYADTTAGLAATVSGDVFMVPDANGIIVYENDTGVAVSLGRFRPAVFDSIAIMATATGLLDGQFVTVNSGFNGTPETFQYDAASTATADGALIVTATGMGVGRLISTRTVLASFDELDADVRIFPDGTILSVVGLNDFEVVSTGENWTLSSGRKVKVLPRNGTINWLSFGAVDDTTELVTGTDNAPSLLAAVNTGYPVIVPAPASGFAFGVSQVSLPRRATIFGPGENTLAIRGISTSATLTGGTVSADLKREYTITDLYVENNRGGDAVAMAWAPDWNFTRVYFRSVSNVTLGTTAARGLNMTNCERGHFSGQCRFGGNPALRLAKDCNGVRGDNVVASGGSLGLAVDLSGNQAIRLKLTIETSLQGVRIADNTGDNLTEGGFSSGHDLSGSYFESVGTPIVAGVGFALNGLNLDDCWLNNAALSDSIPFPVSSEMLKIGRVKSLNLKGGRWVGAGTETALSAQEFVVTSGSAPGMLETSDVDLTVFEGVASLFSHAAITGLANKATMAATNRVYTNDSKTTGMGIPFEWTSDTLTANVSTLTLQLSKDLPAGGRVTSFELIEGDGGSLNGFRVRLGTAAGFDAADVTFGAVNHLYFDFGISDGLLRGGSNIRVATTAGSGAGKFRLRVRGVIGNV